MLENKYASIAYFVGGSAGRSTVRKLLVGCEFKHNLITSRPELPVDELAHGPTEHGRITHKASCQLKQASLVQLQRVLQRGRVFALCLLRSWSWQHDDGINNFCIFVSSVSTRLTPPHKIGRAVPVDAALPRMLPRLHPPKVMLRMVEGAGAVRSRRVVAPMPHLHPAARASASGCGGSADASGRHDTEHVVANLA